MLFAARAVHYSHNCPLTVTDVDVSVVSQISVQVSVSHTTYTFADKTTRNAANSI